MLEIDPESVGTLWLDGLGAPYVHLGRDEAVYARVRALEEERREEKG